MTETSSLTARSGEAGPTDDSPVRARLREQLAATAATARASDEPGLHTLADRLEAELSDLSFQSGHDRAPW